MIEKGYPLVIFFLSPLLSAGEPKRRLEPSRRAGREGINLEADTDQLWQSSTSTSALSAQRARCPSRLSGHGDEATDGLRAQTCSYEGV